MRDSKFMNICKKVFINFNEHDMDVYSGNATLYLLMAMMPLTILFISMANWIPSFTEEEISSLVMNFFPEIPWLQDVLQATFHNLKGLSNGFIAFITALICLYTASNGVSAIQRGLEEINGNTSNQIQGKPKAIVFTLGLILVVPGLILFQLLRGPLINLGKDILTFFRLQDVMRTFISIMRYSRIISILSAILFILLAYTILPTKRKPFKEELPGTLFTVIVGGLFTLGFSLCLDTFWNVNSIYGSLASIFLLTLWLKFIIIIFFIGAELNETLRLERIVKETVVG